MGVVTVKEETEEKLKLGKEPTLFSFSAVIAFMACGYGAAVYSEDSSIWKMVYVIGGLFVGLACIEDWETCEFNKTTNEVRQTHHTVYDKILYTFIPKNEHIVVSNVADIVDVQVEEQTVRYFGKTYQVVIIYNNGIHMGVTESFIYGQVGDHVASANKIKSFLNIPSQDILSSSDNQPIDESSSSEDEFEHVNPAELDNEDMQE